MTSRSQRRWVWIGFLALAVASQASLAEAQSPGTIMGLRQPDGRVVFSNIAVAPSTVTLPPESRNFTAPRSNAISASPYGRLIGTIANRYRVDPYLVRAVIEVESAFDPYAVSARGARGLMQLIPETGARFGVRNPFDAAENIEGGVRYLRYLLDMFDDDLDLTLAAYNSGENRVQRLGRIPRISETENYVRKVQAAYEHVDSPSSAAAAPPIAQGGAGGADYGVTTPTAAISRSIDERGILSFTNLDAHR